MRFRPLPKMDTIALKRKEDLRFVTVTSSKGSATCGKWYANPTFTFSGAHKSDRWSNGIGNPNSKLIPLRTTVTDPFSKLESEIPRTALESVTLWYSNRPLENSTKVTTLTEKSYYQLLFPYSETYLSNSSKTRSCSNYSFQFEEKFCGRLKTYWKIRRKVKSTLNTWKTLGDFQESRVVSKRSEISQKKIPISFYGKQIVIDGETPQLSESMHSDLAGARWDPYRKERIIIMSLFFFLKRRERKRKKTEEKQNKRRKL